MREIEGMVCVGRDERVSIIYGKSVHNENRSFDAIQLNDLTPFDSFENAQAAIGEILRQTLFKDIKIGKIRLLVAENTDDAIKLKEKGSYIALMKDDYDYWLLIGEFVEGKSLRMSSPGSPFQTNGLQPFSNIDDAIEAARQVARQADTYVTIASFELEAR